MKRKLKFAISPTRAENFHCPNWKYPHYSLSDKKHVQSLDKEQPVPSWSEHQLYILHPKPGCYIHSWARRRKAYHLLHPLTGSSHASHSRCQHKYGCLFDYLQVRWSQNRAPQASTHPHHQAPFKYSALPHSPSGFVLWVLLCCFLPQTKSPLPGSVSSRIPPGQYLDTC